MREHTLTVLGQVVRHWRSESRLSQEALADRCGFHRTYVGQLERGERNPSLISLLTLCRGLDVTLPDFFTRYADSLGTPL